MSKHTCKSKGQDPPQKHTRQIPPTLPIQQDQQPSVLSSLANALVFLQTLPVDATDENLTWIYLTTQQYHQVKCNHQGIKADDFVDQTQFIANVRQQESKFLEAFRKTMEANENGDDMKAFLGHS